MEIEKTIAWFLGVNSWMSSHMATWTRIACPEDEGGEEFFSCESVSEDRRKSIHSSIKRKNMADLYFIAVCFMTCIP